MIWIFFIVCLSVPALLYLWFRTGVFIEYARILKLDEIFKIKDFMADRDFKGTYQAWLGRRHGNKFLIRLILCPFCLGFWFSAILSCIFLNPLYTLAVYTMSIIIYLIMNKL